jgi:hypothetical protein
VAELATHPQYEQNKAQFDGAVTAARAAGDELAQSRAELAWERAQRQMGDDLAAQERQASEVSNLRLRMKAEHPAVPEAAYAHLTDAAAIEATVKAVAEAMAAQQPPYTPPAPPNGTQTQPPTGQQWPAPPSNTPPPPPAPDDPLDDPAVYSQTLSDATTKPNTPAGKAAAAAIQDRTMRRIYAGSEQRGQLLRDPSSPRRGGQPQF